MDSAKNKQIKKLKSELSKLKKQISKSKSNELKLNKLNKKLEKSSHNCRLHNQALKDSELKYKRLFNSLNSGVAVYKAVENGKDFVFEEFNKTGLKIEKINRNKILGKKVTDVFPGIEKLGLFKVFKKVYRTGKPEVHSTSFYKDKRVSGWRTNYVYRLGSNKIVAIYEDVTESVNREIELRNQKEMLETIINNIPIMITIYDSKLKNISINKESYRLTGWTDKDIKQKGFLKCILPNIKERKRAEKHMKITDKAWHDFRIKKKNGTYIDSIWSNINLSDNRRIGIGVDITERRKSEQILQENERRFQLIANTIDNVIWITSPDMKQLLYISPAYEKIFGKSIEKAYQAPTSFISLIHPDDKKTFLKELKQKSRTTHNTEYRIVRSDGSVRWIHGRRHPVCDDKGKQIMKICVSTDITDIKLAEEREKQIEAEKAKREILETSKVELENSYDQLRKTQSQLIQAEKLSSIGLLASGVAHELNSPLTGLLGLLRSFLTKTSNTVEHKKISQMLIASEKMAKIISDLTSFARSSKNEITNMDINVLLDSMLELSSTDLINNNIQISKCFDNDLPKFRGDSSKIEQVFLNIINNAKDAMENGGKLEITTLHSIDNNQIEIIFKDRGTGIFIKDINKIFDPFFTTKSAGKGTGLGLSVSKGIIEDHNGKISVINNFGKGTKFTIILPITL